jgi:ribose 1,5-bisphosphokinase PhnN
MNEKAPFRRLQIANTRETYAAITAVVVPALRTALEELASRREGDDRTWYDELEARLIRDAKGTITEGFPIEVEAASLKAGIDVLQATLDVVRSNLIDKKTD